MSQIVKPVSPILINAFFDLLVESDFYGKCPTVIERDIRSLNISLFEQLQVTANTTELVVSLMREGDQANASEELHVVAAAFQASGWDVDWKKDVTNHDKSRSYYTVTFTAR